MQVDETLLREARVLLVDDFVATGIHANIYSFSPLQSIVTNNTLTVYDISWGITIYIKRVNCISLVFVYLVAIVIWW